jgi:hypothetical protein
MLLQRVVLLQQLERVNDGVNSREPATHTFCPVGEFAEQYFRRFQGEPEGEGATLLVKTAAYRRSLKMVANAYQAGYCGFKV